ncbi:hypothetical protein EVAR_29470_1 [Eumeta japonica]|uniref:Uncharacterized protein n=1 Tax=Eumeta variegata TaxID=151549 RepID=A0A4C1WWF2_EUMVA|nr:hypothetical protein EVAR_29470_1 [Eumeta japonica]
MIFTTPFFADVLFKRTASAAEYIGEFNVQFGLDNSERSWSTIQGVVPRNEIARSCTPRSRATPRLLQVLAGDSGYLYACRFKLHGSERFVSGAIDRYRSSLGGIKVKCGG